MLSRLSLLSILLSLTVLPSLRGQLVAYEGFQYPVTRQTPSLWPVTNKAPDGQPLKYFSELDTHASRAPHDYTMQILNGSIPTKGSAFPFKAEGNSLSWVREWMDAYGTIDPNFQFDTSSDNSAIYLSFIIRANKSANSLRQITVAFSNGSSHRLQVGVDDSSNTGSARFFACAASPQPNREYSKREFLYDTTYFIVAKISTSSRGKDMVRMVAYGPGEKVPGSDSRISWLVEVGDWTDFLVTDVAISLYGGDAGGVMIDELRIGSNWASVAVAPKSDVVAKSETADTSAGSADTMPETDSGESIVEAEKSSPIVLVLIGLGIIGFFAGGVAFYLFVLKPSKDGPSKPKSAPIKPASKPTSAETKADPVPPSAPTDDEEPPKSKGPAPRKPIKPPPPK
ncbi:hypothetical protein [Cerasicoccus arenae]|uniref:Uncharacterized protein n=1 Tax=Cerasicoccus arenae TaxID=424488 RepID=A0A8J3D9D0_9BACT|nr:hypothetical protein [Cerasicoccus arenae]MBK1857133.1 hypothetical protein [Cerasicoccus arenae]GHB92557.1 hypothetical protein GCM10007047_04650 [Cerasicoccus arenae]